MSEALVVGIVRQAHRAGHHGQPADARRRPASPASLVSIFQTVTSIQDNVLAFIPRAAAIFVVFALTFPWMLRVPPASPSGWSSGCPSWCADRIGPDDDALAERIGILLVRPGMLLMATPVSAR